MHHDMKKREIGVRKKIAIAVHYNMRGIEFGLKKITCVVHYDMRRREFVVKKNACAMQYNMRSIEFGARKHLLVVCNIKRGEFGVQKNGHSAMHCDMTRGHEKSGTKISHNAVLYQTMRTNKKSSKT